MSDSIVSLLARATACVVLLGANAALAESAAKQADYTAMSAGELAEYLIFDAKGFKLDQETQEGGTVRDRLTQDELQKVCSGVKEGLASGATAAKVSKLARDSFKYPEGGIKLGDWKKGEELARSGFGFRVGHNIDEHDEKDAKKVPGGNCYACHELDPNEFTYGTIGPSLKGYGRLRGSGEDMIKYTYEMIYNAHAYFPCTRMPRFGANQFLTQQQIADIMAYVMHPESPVNQETAGAGTASAR